MSAGLRKFVQATLPPLLFDAVLRLRGLRYGFHGDYASYEEALQHCHTASAFSSDRVIETAIRNARDGSDTPGVILTSREQQLLAAVLMPLLACGSKSEVRVLDFGGGLGADFRRIRAMLPSDWCLLWEVFETAAMAEAGHQHVNEEGLRFISDWGSAHGTYDLVIASSSIQYTPEPVDTFQRLSALSSDYVVVTRLPLIPGSRDRLTVQRVSPSYYDVSYPAWFLGEGKWLPLFEQHFVIRRRWDVPEDHLLLDGRRVMNRGLLLERRR